MKKGAIALLVLGVMLLVTVKANAVWEWAVVGSQVGTAVTSGAGAVAGGAAATVDWGTLLKDNFTSTSGDPDFQALLDDLSTGGTKVLGLIKAQVPQFSVTDPAKFVADLNTKANTLPAAATQLSDTDIASAVEGIDAGLGTMGAKADEASRVIKEKLAAVGITGLSDQAVMDIISQALSNAGEISEDLMAEIDK